MDSPSIVVMNTDVPRGPQLSIKSSYVRYVKDLSSSYIQQESERNYEDIVFPEDSESKSEQKVQPLTNKDQKKVVNFKFTSIAKQNKLIEKFKNNLLQYSYIMPQKFKAKLQAFEKYLQKDKRKVSNQRSNNNSKYIISPSNIFLFYWEILSIIIHFVSLWICGFALPYPNYQEFSFKSFGSLFLAFILIDVVISLNKEIYNSGQLVNTRHLIMQNYLTKFLHVDVLSFFFWILISFDLLYSNQAVQIFAILQMILILIRIFRIYDFIVEQLYQKGFGGYAFDLFTLVICIYFFAHIMACTWLMVGLSSHNDQMNWIKDNDLVNESVWTQYNNAFYWSTMTMVTVGYGDITPKNNLEMVFANFAMFLSSCIFAYSMNAIGILVKGINDVKQNYKQIFIISRKSVVIMNQYMRSNKVDDQIQNKVRNYLKYLIYNQESDNIDANKLVNKLSIGLQQELNSDILGKIIKNIKVLSYNFSKQILQETQSLVEIIQFSPGEYIQKGENMGNAEEIYLYYIIKGTVNFMSNQTNQLIYQQTVGDTFNQYEFFTGFCDEKINIVSEDFCQLVKLSKKQFLKLICESKRDWELFYAIKDNAANNYELTDLNYKCQFCFRGTHLRQNCPLLTYQPNVQHKLKKQQKYLQEQYRSFKTRNCCKMNTRVILDEVKQTIQIYMLNNINDYTENLSRKESKVQIEQDDEQQYQQIQQQQQKQQYNKIEFIQSTPIRNNPTKKVTLIQNNMGSQNFIKSKLQAGTPLRAPNQLAFIKETSHQNSTNQSQPNITQSLQQTHSFRMLDQIYNSLKFSNIELDQMQNYIYYMPQNNLKRIIQKQETQQNKDAGKTSIKVDKSFGFTAKLRNSKLKNNAMRKQSSHIIQF